MGTTTVYAICANKGGVGKTSTTNTLAKELALRSAQNGTESKVLVIDIDRQGCLNDLRTKDMTNLSVDTTSEEFSFFPKERQTKIRRMQQELFILQKQMPFRAYTIIHIDLNNVDMIKRAIATIHSNKYDYVLIDCPGGASLEHDSEGGGLADFLPLADFIFTPIYYSDHDAHGADFFLNELTKAPELPRLKEVRLIHNKVNIQNPGRADILENMLLEKYPQFSFFASRIKRSALSEQANTIIPTSLKIGVINGSVKTQPGLEDITNLATEVLTLTAKYN